LYDELLGTSAADAHTTEEIVDLTETPGPVR
jgi:hypothetical protein